MPEEAITDIIIINCTVIRIKAEDRQMDKDKESSIKLFLLVALHSDTNILF